MKPEDLTLWFLRVWLLAILAFDAYAIVCFTPQATVSGVAARVIEDNPILAVLLGCVVAHLCWPIAK